MTVEDVLGIKKPATEETLQSIDGTLKRIEAILRQGLLQSQSFALDVQDPSLQQLKGNSTELHVEPK